MVLAPTLSRPLLTPTLNLLTPDTNECNDVSLHLWLRWPSHSEWNNSSVSGVESRSLVGTDILTNWEQNQRQKRTKSEHDKEKTVRIGSRGVRLEVRSSSSSMDLVRYSSITSPKIDFLPEEFIGELNFIDPILPGIDEDDFDEEDFDEEEGENDNDILQIEDEILREKLLNVNLLVDKIEALEPLIYSFLISFLVRRLDTTGIESDLDSEGDIVFLDNLLNEDSIPKGGEIDVEDTILPHLPFGTDIKEMDKIKAKTDKAEHEKERVNKSRELSSYGQQKSTLVNNGQLTK
ncbi:hypothetical protein Tco_1393543 [Tanacetum coccineum]